MKNIRSTAGYLGSFTLQWYNSIILFRVDHVLRKVAGLVLLFTCALNVGIDLGRYRSMQHLAHIIWQEY